MNQTNSNRQLTPKRQAWVDRLQALEWETGRRVLACYTARGLAAMEQVEKLSGLSHKQIRLATSSLGSSAYGLPPLLRSETVSLFSRPGRPVRVDLLTADGLAVLRELVPDAAPSQPELNDRIELAHAYVEMEIFTAARAAGRTCELEKVLPMGASQYIRADAVVGSAILFEVEQVARLPDVPRIQDKLSKLVNFFSSPASKGTSPEIRILFNLPKDDGTSLEIWQTVLAGLGGQQGKLPFILFCRPILEFLERPAWDNLDGFLPLEPKAGPQPAAAFALPATASKGSSLLAPVGVLPAFLNQQVKRVPNANIILKSMEIAYQPMAARWAEGRQDEVFFDTMRTIYEASHYAGGPVRERAEVPTLSLILLYRYLRLSQQEGLLKVIQLAWVDMQRGLYHGVNLFRDAYTRLCWLFLRRHGFGPGGPLGVRVVVPSFQDPRSDVYVEVEITDRHFVIGEDNLLLQDDLQRTEKALAWVLEALWTYGEELGLKPKPKKKGE